MKLVIVESPSKAKTIQKYLGKDFRVMASGGHICDLPTKTLGIDISDRFKPEYVVADPKKKELIKRMKKEVKDAGLPSRYAATKVVEGDPITLSKLNLTDSEKEIIDNIVREMETNLGTDREAALADMRYDFIANACRDAVKKNGNARELQRSIQIDRVLTHKYFGIPIFLCVMLLTFFLTFNVIGAVLSDWLSLGIDTLTGLLDQGLAKGADLAGGPGKIHR